MSFGKAVGWTVLIIITGGLALPFLLIAGSKNYKTEEKDGKEYVIVKCKRK